MCGTKSGRWREWVPVLSPSAPEGPTHWRWRWGGRCDAGVAAGIYKTVGVGWVLWHWLLVFLLLWLFSSRLLPPPLFPLPPPSSGRLDEGVYVYEPIDLTVPRTSLPSHMPCMIFHFPMKPLFNSRHARGEGGGPSGEEPLNVGATIAVTNGVEVVACPVFIPERSQPLEKWVQRATPGWWGRACGVWGNGWSWSLSSSSTA